MLDFTVCPQCDSWEPILTAENIKLRYGLRWWLCKYLCHRWLAQYLEFTGHTLSVPTSRGWRRLTSQCTSSSKSLKKSSSVAHVFMEQSQRSEFTGEHYFTSPDLELCSKQVFLRFQISSSHEEPVSKCRVKSESKAYFLIMTGCFMVVSFSYFLITP